MAQNRYPIPAGRHRVEITVKRSRFIASAAETDSVDAARRFRTEIRDEFPDATHHVYAFQIGFGSTVTFGLSDDGEPSGTAGKPVLRVVETSGLGDVCVVVTRYFGGTKLGTGGLVKAYTEAAQAVIAELPRSERREIAAVAIRVPYAALEKVRKLVDRLEGTVEMEEFSEVIRLTLVLPRSHVERFCAELRDTTSGRGVIEEGAGG